jgi:beta-galactosidase
VRSGEIHYFRLDPRHWEKHLRALVRAGANTTSTYIPWDWHAPSERQSDFTGETHPGRNLVRYIELCAKVGLDLIVKPGPYILAEYELHGLPGWLLDRCAKTTRSLDERGNVISPDLMCYMSEEFLRHAFLWYDQVMPILAHYQEKNGGPIIMMQLCNEVGVFQWLSGKIDYNPAVVTIYRTWLEERYRAIGRVNAQYGTAWTGFDQAFPPHGTITTRDEYRAYYDFHLFYRHYFALYLDTLARKVRSFDIHVQLSHNIPGWIFGNAAELPMLISTYEEVMKTRSDIVFGLDHIPEFFSFRNAHSDLACNKFLSAMQPYGPVWAAEYQAGTREHFVRNDPNDMEAFYAASLAHGLNSFNYYMFSQGINPKGKGHYGKTFYYQTPLNVQGEKSPLYDVAKRNSGFIRREAQHLLTSTSKAHICVGLYKPYFYTELTTSQMLKDRRLHVEKLGLAFDPRFVREELFFHGLLRGLQTLNFNYDISDLERSSPDDLLHYRQLWMVTTEFMDAGAQELLAAYVNRGGHLIMYPAVPTLDTSLRPCTVLSEKLGLRFENARSGNKVDAFGIEDVFSLTEQKQIFESKEEEAIARTNNGAVCGISKRVREGRVTVMGFSFGYSTDEHLALYEKIIGLDRIKRDVKVSDPDIQFVLRRGKKRVYLFLMNYHNQKKSFTVGSRRYTLGPLSCKIVIVK